MQIIYVQDTPAQTLTVNLAGQQVQLNLYTRSQDSSGSVTGNNGLYCDVEVNNVQLVGGVYCTNLVPIMQDSYLGLVGDLVWLDTQGTRDPLSPGLGSRFVLYYLSAFDLNGAG